MKIIKDHIFLNQPPELKISSSKKNLLAGKSIVVLDDDPTGCQTIHNVELLFSWDLDLLTSKLEKKTPVFFIMANTRSLEASVAKATIREICINLRKASNKTGQDFIIISRSDSTLRGHYPDEPDVISEVLKMRNPLHCLIPAFFQGGRYTVNDIHYVQEGEYFIPAAETPFAKDKSFGFKSSNLFDYIIEKTEGRICREEITNFSLSEIREKSTEKLIEKLSDRSLKACFVNALTQSDLDIFANAAIHSLNQGREIIFRTAASFLNSIAAIPQKNLLKKDDLKKDTSSGGLFIIGSYVPKTSSQLEVLLQENSLIPYEINVEDVLLEKVSEIRNLSLRMSQDIESGKDIVLFTQRKLISGKTIKKNLEIGKKISDYMVSLIKSLKAKPAYILTKGGITSHVIIKDALEIKETMVLGQILPGVPVVSNENGKFKGIPVIIFPGNVGDQNSLIEIYNELK